MNDQQLSLWNLLDAAATEPEEVDFDQIWTELDAVRMLDNPCEQLEIAGSAISKIAEIFALRSRSAFEDLEATAAKDGPVMAIEEFDRYVRQTMQLDLTQYIEPLERLPRTFLGQFGVEIPTEYEPASTVVAPVEKEDLIEAIAELDETAAKEKALLVAHEEDISQWREQIQVWLQDQPSAVSLARIQQGTGLSIVKIWLAALLGGFKLERRSEDFYGEVWLTIQQSF